MHVDRYAAATADSALLSAVANNASMAPRFIADPEAEQVGDREKLTLAWASLLPNATSCFLRFRNHYTHLRFLHDAAWNISIAEAFKSQIRRRAAMA